MYITFFIGTNKKAVTAISLRVRTPQRLIAITTLLRVKF